MTAGQSRNRKGQRACGAGDHRSVLAAAAAGADTHGGVVASSTALDPADQAVTVPAGLEAGPLAARSGEAASFDVVAGSPPRTRRRAHPRRLTGDADGTGTEGSDVSGVGVRDLDGRVALLTAGSGTADLREGS